MESGNSLKILGATYGLRIVTDIVRSKVQNNCLHIKASNSIFGDTWQDVCKSLHVIYQYGNYKPQTASVQEGSQLSIVPTADNQEDGEMSTAGELQIYGAAYGLAVVTKHLKKLCKLNNIKLTASNNFFGETFPGWEKSFTCVYSLNGGSCEILVVKENQPISFKETPNIKIYKAAYGHKDVTSKVYELLLEQGSKSLNFKANNQTFGDSSGEEKSFVLLYSFGDDSPRLHISKYSATVDISYNAISYIQTQKQIVDDDDLGFDLFGDDDEETVKNTLVAQVEKEVEVGKSSVGLKILAAAYGLADATQKCRSLIEGDTLAVQASNHVFGDTWPDIVKTLVTFYQYDDGPIKMKISPENHWTYINRPVFIMQAELENLIKIKAENVQLVTFHNSDFEYLLLPKNNAQKILQNAFKDGGLDKYMIKAPNFDTKEFAFIMKTEISKNDYIEISSAPYCFGVVYGKGASDNMAFNFFVDSEKNLHFFDPKKGKVDDSLIDHYSFTFIL